MEPLPISLLVSLVGLGTLLAKIIEILITFVVKKLSNGHQERQNEELRNQIRSLHDWHSQVDEDGKFIWYFPKGVLEHQAAQSEQLQELSFIQRDMLKNFDRIIDILERMERRQLLFDNKMSIPDNRIEKF